MNIKCGNCGRDYSGDSWTPYYDHECSAADGAKPNTPEFLVKTTQPNYIEVAAAAIARGRED